MMQRTFGAAALAGLAALLSVTPPAGGQQPLKATYTGLYFAVKDRHGDRAPGRDIRRHGVRTRSGARPATTRDLARSIRTLRRMLTPVPISPPQMRSQNRNTPVVAASVTPVGSGLDAIARCESGGNPRAVSPDGIYRGLYQFDRQTWASVGGSGDPAAASESEQDMRAAKLYAQRGAAPWPLCGK